MMPELGTTGWSLANWQQTAQGLVEQAPLAGLTGAPVAAASLEEFKRRLTDQLHNSRLDLPHAVALRRLPEEGLQILAELERLGSPDRYPTPARALMEEGYTRVVELLDQVSLQFELLDQQQRWCRLLEQPLVELGHTGTTAVSSLHDLGEQAWASYQHLSHLNQRAEVASGSLVWPLPGLDCVALLSATGWQRAAFAMEAFYAVQIMLHTGEQLSFGRRRDLCAWSVATALCDLGLAAESVRSRRLDVMLRRRLTQLHPARGAAMLAGVRHLPSEWLQLIREHHERFDGSGLPHGRTGRELSKISQLVAMSRAAAHTMLQLTSRKMSLRLPTAAALWRESRRGGFDQRLTDRVLESWSPGLAGDVAQWWQRERILRIDGPQGLSAPRAFRRELAAARQEQRDAVRKPYLLRRTRSGRKLIPAGSLPTGSLSGGEQS